jgi:hypothetical protein
MIQIIKDKKLIAKNQREFIQQLKKVCTEKIVCSVGYQGYSQEETVYFSEKYNFWFTSSTGQNRFWNAFTIGKPKDVGSNSINVEINIPFEGINRTIGGVFGHNKNGEVLLLHRGNKINGVTKQQFCKSLRGDPTPVDDDGIEDELFLIGSINSKLLPKQVSNFIGEVLRIKTLFKKGVRGLPNFQNFIYTKEHSGVSKIEKKSLRIIERTHGIIVNALASKLETKGFSIGNDRNMDLYIHKNGRIRSLFEIKTSSSTQDLCSAIGQLLMYSLPINTSIKLYLVLPKKLTNKVEKRLKEYGLDVLYYNWHNNSPTFRNLKTL